MGTGSPQGNLTGRVHAATVAGDQVLAPHELIMGGRRRRLFWMLSRRSERAQRVGHLAETAYCHWIAPRASSIIDQVAIAPDSVCAAVYETALPSVSRRKQGP